MMILKAMLLRCRRLLVVAPEVTHCPTYFPFFSSSRSPITTPPTTAPAIRRPTHTHSRMVSQFELKTLPVPEMPYVYGEFRSLLTMLEVAAASPLLVGWYLMVRSLSPPAVTARGNVDAGSREKSELPSCSMSVIVRSSVPTLNNCTAMFLSAEVVPNEMASTGFVASRGFPFATPRPLAFSTEGEAESLLSMFRSGLYSPAVAGVNTRFSVCPSLGLMAMGCAGALTQSTDARVVVGALDASPFAGVSIRGTLKAAGRSASPK